MCKKGIIIIILFLINYSVFADNYNFHNISVEEGLYHSSISNICQDKYGFMWISSYEGLQRFDGKSFTNYNRYNHSRLFTHSYITKLYIPPNKDLLFIGGSNASFSILNIVTSNIKTYNYDEVFTGESFTVTCFKIYNDSIYFMGTNRPGRLYYFNLKSEKTKNLECRFNEAINEELESVNDIYVDAKSCIWVATSSGLFKSDDIDLINNKIHFVRISNINNVQSILDWDQSNLSVTAEKAILQVNKKTLQVKDITPNGLKEISFRRHTKDEKGNLWIGTFNQGVIKFNVSTGTYNLYQHDPLQTNSLLNNDSEAIFYSTTDSIIWIGSDRGVSYLNTQHSPFKYYTPITKDKEVIDNNFGYLIDSDNNIWVYSIKDCYYSDNGYESFVKIDKNHPKFGFLYGHDILDIYEDENKVLWFATNEGFYSYNLIKQQVTEYKINNSKYKSYYNNIRKIYQYGDSLWLATEGGIVLFNRTNKKFKVFPVPDNLNLSSGAILSRDIIYDPKGYIWLGVNLDGIYRYNLDKKIFNHYIHENGNANSLTANDFISFYKDSDDDIWIATYTGGVSKYSYDSDDFVNYTADNKLPSNSVYAILEDESNNLWMSTNRGIVKINKKSNDIDVYSFYDGLYIYEFNMGAFFKSPDGEMHFGGVGGVVSFYPKDVLMNTKPPKIYLTDLHIQNKLIPTDSDILNHKSLMYHQKISLPYKKSTIYFDVSLIEYMFPLRTKFAWKLNTYDIDWNYSIKNQTTISYTNLPPGKYELLLKSTSDNMNWSSVPYKLSIEIVPPWWKTDWFRTSLLILIILCALLFYYLRINILKKQKEHLNQLIDEKTEELKALNESLEESNAEINAQNDELVRYRKHLENIVKERTQNLEEALKLAEESAEFKSAILRNMSHEIRTPLNAIVGYSQFLGDDDIDDQERDQLISSVIRNSNTLLDVIENVIEISKLESGDVEVIHEPLNLKNLIDDLIADLSDKLSENVKLIFKPESELIINTDSIKLKSVLKQVIHNAINYTEKGFVEIRYSIKEAAKINYPHKIKNLLTSKKYLLIEVEDTGIGIPVEDEDKIYEPFRKVESYKDKLFRGVGLGLSITKRIVDLLKGEIWHKSKQGEGTIFYIILPYSVSMRQDRLNFKGQITDDFEGKNILIADDSLEWFNIAKFYLKKFKANLVWARDGNELIDLVMKQEFDLIIIDIRMPNMDGCKTMEKLKQLKPDIIKTPVIALSGFEYTDLTEKIKTAGFIDFLQKPVSYNTFIKMLNKYLSKPSED